MSDKIDVGSIDELRAFHRHLVQFNQVLEQEYRSFAGHLGQINAVWNDAMYARLVESLHDAFRGIEAYLQVAPEPDAYLAQLIRELQDILHRFGR